MQDVSGETNYPPKQESEVKSPSENSLQQENSKVFVWCSWAFRNHSVRGRPKRYFIKSIVDCHPICGRIDKYLVSRQAVLAPNCLYELIHLRSHVGNHICGSSNVNINDGAQSLVHVGIHDIGLKK
jgi:hypothetical protein